MQDGVFGVLFLRNDLLHKKEILAREKKEILTRGKKRFDETEKVRDNGNLFSDKAKEEGSLVKWTKFSFPTFVQNISKEEGL